MSRRASLVLAASMLLLWARAARAETYVDPETGFSLQVPDKWRQIPIAGEERYIVGKWQSEREYVAKTEYVSHRPELKVILFDPKATKKAEVGEAESGGKFIRIENPYKSFKDYVKSDGEGGRYISKEEEITVNGVATTWYEVAYEKLTVPRHGLAFVYHAPDIDYCVMTEVLEEQWKKLSPDLIRVLKSFRVIPRTGAVKRETTGEHPDFVIATDLDKLTPEQRYARRQEQFERRLKKATEKLPEGWKVKRSKNYVAITHTDDKYTAMILEQAEGIRAWAEANFSFFGPGIAGSEMLRICKDWDEERAFKDISSRSGYWSDEITLSREEAEWGPKNVGRDLFDRWLQDKNPRLVYSLPPWLASGIRDWVQTCYVKGGKLESRPDSRELFANVGAFIRPFDLVQWTYQDFGRHDKESGTGGRAKGLPEEYAGMLGQSVHQSVAFVRYLLSGPGRTSAKTKDLLRTYVTALDAYVREQDGKTSEGAQAPQSEEEEAERFKKRESFWKEHQKDLLKTVFERAFPDWTDADWAALEKTYRKYAS